jgi:hypothetical protein
VLSRKKKLDSFLVEFKHILFSRKLFSLYLSGFLFFNVTTYIITPEKGLLWPYDLKSSHLFLIALLFSFIEFIINCRFIFVYNKE